MDLVEFIKLGGKISLNKKMELADWYSEITFSYFDNEPFFTGFSHKEYRKNLTIEESVYLFLSVYKDWNNYAYLAENLKRKNEFPEGLEDYDFEHPSKEITALFKKEKKLAKEAWHKEFSQERLDSFKKPILNNLDGKLESLLKEKDYIEYYDVLNNYATELFNLGVDYDINVHFEMGENIGFYGVRLLNTESSKNQINDIITGRNRRITYKYISICLDVDKQRYVYVAK